MCYKFEYHTCNEIFSCSQIRTRCIQEIIFIRECIKRDRFYLRFERTEQRFKTFYKRNISFRKHIVVFGILNRFLGHSNHDYFLVILMSLNSVQNAKKWKCVTFISEKKVVRFFSTEWHNWLDISQKLNFACIELEISL